jgi:hypothetical protein
MPRDRGKIAQSAAEDLPPDRPGGPPLIGTVIV